MSAVKWRRAIETESMVASGLADAGAADSQCRKAVCP